MGLSARKADYLLNIAEAFREDPDLSSLEEMSDEDVTEMVERAERWRPHRSLASLYVWRAKREAGG